MKILESEEKLKPEEIILQSLNREILAGIRSIRKKVKATSNGSDELKKKAARLLKGLRKELEKLLAVLEKIPQESFGEIAKQVFGETKLLKKEIDQLLDQELKGEKITTPTKEVQQPAKKSTESLKQKDEVLSLSGSDEDVGKILKDKNFYQEITIDYSQTLKDMISAGKYSLVVPEITQEHFPISSKDSSEKEVVLFHFNKKMTSEEVIDEMNKAGFKPANIEELLALGANRPELQKEFPIIALGSVWQKPDGNRLVPLLYCAGSERYLSLGWDVNWWFPNYRFVAVRKFVSRRIIDRKNLLEYLEIR